MSLHSHLAGQALTPTHPQALQVTAEARALHVDEGLGEKHGGMSGHPVALGLAQGLVAALCTSVA